MASNLQIYNRNLDDFMIAEITYIIVDLPKKLTQLQLEFMSEAF